jgi:hypothetical protein
MNLPARRRQTARRAPILLAAAAAIAAVALSGCAAGATAAAPGAGPGSTRPEPSATTIAGDAVSGTGSTELGGVEFAIPEGAKSVVIAFECDGGGRYAVELGDSMMLGQAFLQGTCEGTADLAWPIEDLTEELLLVRVSDGVEWSATPTFSTAPFVYDEELTADCATFAEAYSALMNADQGYTLYDAFGEDEWTQRVDGAAADLAALAETADSAIAEGVASLRDLASDPDRTTGAVLSAEAMTAIGSVSQACDKNQSPLILSGEFGG